MWRVMAILGLLLVGLPAPALAQPSSDPFEGQGGGTVDVPSGQAGCAVTGTCTGRVLVGSAHGGPGSGTSLCQWHVGPFNEIYSYVPAYPTVPTDAPDGPHVIVRCPVSGLGIVPVDFFALGDPPEPAIAREMAERAVTVPLPVASFSPRRELRQVVGVETWVWMDRADTVPRSARACVGPFDYACVTVAAGFVSLGADMGDGGDPLDCGGPGVPYDFDLDEEEQAEVPHCGHVYTRVPRHGTTYPVRLAAEWFVTWSCLFDSDGDGVRESSCGGGALPPLVRVSDPVPLEVVELQAIAIPNQ